MSLQYQKQVPLSESGLVNNYTTGKQMGLGVTLLLAFALDRKLQIYPNKRWNEGEAESERGIQTPEM